MADQILRVLHPPTTVALLGNPFSQLIPLRLFYAVTTTWPLLVSLVPFPKFFARTQRAFDFRTIFPISVAVWFGQ